MLRYRLIFENDDNGTILVTSPDMPIVTYGVDKPEALGHADEAVRAILASMMDAREDIPVPDFEHREQDEVLKLPWQTELKVELYRALRDAGLTRADLQRRLGWQRESVDRLFRLDHNSRLDNIEDAFEAFGKSVRFTVTETRVGGAAAA